MAGAREIRTKIKSVANTRKVTSALQMVSASKIRRAQELMRTSRPYARHMRRVVAHIAQATPDYQHPALKEREIKRVCYLIVSTDRGLCGGLNSNLFRKVLADIHGWQQKGVGVEVIAIGQKAAQFFRRIKVDLVGTVTHLGDHPRLEKLVGVMKIADDAFMQGKIDRIYLCYNQFVNTMTQRATVEAMVYHATLENLASEHAARMVAMKAASDNATKAIGTLTLVYNKARQAAITQEISEIVGGAAAVGG